ncbi:MAG: TIGR04076 family protein [Ruminococcaceae bacterium]|nr:TIGR04076 family protein [Oscillospiraceae bacterium]
MKRVRITAIRKTVYPDLIEKYENPIEHSCDVKEGQVWIAEGWEKPQGFCDSAWESISAFVMTLAHGGENFYDGWMKNPKTAMISCNDGFRPVSFYLEALEEDCGTKNGEADSDTEKV